MSNNSSMTPHASAPPERMQSPPGAGLHMALPVAELISELGRVLQSLAVEKYATPRGPLFLDASIGGHVRHTLDHVRALLQGIAAGTIDYDTRTRGTSVESDLGAALAEIRALVARLHAVAELPSGSPLAVRFKPTRDGEPVLVHSTLARELAFVHSHTIHHHATIRSMIISLGGQLPDSFGYAPSTLAFLRK